MEPKNPHAVALGKLGGKARKLTTEEAREIGKIGGKARMKTMTAKQRQEIARRAVTARWSKKK